MRVTVKVEHLVKSFRLTKKQMQVNKNKEKIIVAANDVSFETYEGEVFGLLGSNGAGKTTTLRCVATLIKPDKGSISVCDHDLNDDISIKGKIAFLTNEIRLEDQMTPNYAFNYFGRFHNMSTEKIEARRIELFNRFDIIKFSEVKIGDLSTGMKQKVSIAVSLVHDPEVIIFDEPTNGLDVLTARNVTDYLKEMAQRGRTVIVSTHIMSLAQKICDRIAIIAEGRIIECDTVSNIIAKYNNPDLEEIFFELYKGRVGEKA